MLIFTTITYSTGIVYTCMVIHRMDTVVKLGNNNNNNSMHLHYAGEIRTNSTDKCTRCQR